MQDVKILFIEDSQADVDAATWELQKNGCAISGCERVHTRDGLKRAIRSESWDLVIGEYSLLSFTDLEALKIVRELRPDLPYVMVSGTVGVDAAVKAMKAGASEYLLKGRLQRLASAVERELRETSERRSEEEARRKSEEQLRLDQRMESVGRLAGGVAHDFNNILSVVSGYANLLQMKMAKTGSAPRELMEIEKAVVKATALVRQLLTFSRKQVAHPRILDLDAVVSESLPMLRTMVGEAITLEIRSEKPSGRVKADKNLVEQLLRNLAVNAKESMPRGGTLSIGLSSETLDPNHFRQGERFLPGKSICLTFRDTGPGIPAEFLQRIFEPFFSARSEGRGSGLALSTVYSLARNLGGTIRVESDPAKGAAFSIHFPCVPDSEAESADSTSQPETRGVPAPRETILLVEDDSDLRKLAKDILVLEGYHVLEPATPQDALGFARSTELKIDLLLTDLAMPGMNGKEMAEAVLAIRPEVRVVYMSGYPPEDMLPDADLISEVCFLEKPFSPAKLLAKVRDALDAYKVEKHL